MLLVCARLGPPKGDVATNNHVIPYLKNTCTIAPLWHRLGMNIWYTSWTGFLQNKNILLEGPTVDGRNHAPVDIVNITGTFTFQVVQDFFHQQYHFEETTRYLNLLLADPNLLLNSSSHLFWNSVLWVVGYILKGSKLTSLQEFEGPRDTSCLPHEQMLLCMKTGYIVNGVSYSP